MPPQLLNETNAASDNKTFTSLFEDGHEAAFPDWQGALVSALFASIAIVLSFVLIRKHLENFSKPVYQRHIVRILLMVPVYSICGWLTYMLPHWAVKLELIRSCYEALVIYEFFALLLEYLGDNEMEQRRILASKPSGPLMWPLCWVNYHPESRYFLMDMKILALQYIVVRPATAVMELILESQNEQESGNFWLGLLNFLSTGIAMYALVMFYFIIRHDIKEYRPVNKFLSVKFVVFMTFWQSLAISILVYFGQIPKSPYWDLDYIGLRVQSFMICVEMFIASLWHLSDYCFGYGDFRVDEKTDIWAGLRVCFDPRETIWEILLAIRHIIVRVWVLIFRRKHQEVRTTEPDTAIPNVEEAPEQVYSLTGLQ